MLIQTTYNEYVVANVFGVLKHNAANTSKQIYHCADREEQSSVELCLLDCLYMMWSGAHCWHPAEMSQNTALLTTQDWDWC